MSSRPRGYGSSAQNARKVGKRQIIQQPIIFLGSNLIVSKLWTFLKKTASKILTSRFDGCYRSNDL